MARIVGTSAPTWQEIKETIEATSSLHPLAEPPSLAGSSRWEHNGTTVTLIPRLTRDTARTQDTLERTARDQARTSAYIDALTVNRDTAFVLLATHGTADTDRILAAAFRAPDTELDR